MVTPLFLEAWQIPTPCMEWMQQGPSLSLCSINESNMEFTAIKKDGLVVKALDWDIRAQFPTLPQTSHVTTAESFLSPAISSPFVKWVEYFTPQACPENKLMFVWSLAITVRPCIYLGITFKDSTSFPGHLPSASFLHSCSFNNQADIYNVMLCHVPLCTSRKSISFSPRICLHYGNYTGIAMVLA